MKKAIILVSIFIFCSLIFKGVLYTQTRSLPGSFRVSGAVISKKRFETVNVTDPGTPDANIGWIYMEGDALYFEHDGAKVNLGAGAAGGDPDQNLWETIAADVGGPVLANTITDTLTIAGGTNTTTTISGDTVTIDVTGGAGDVTASAVLGDELLIRGDGAVKGVQNSGITIDDSDNVSAIGTLGTTGLITTGVGLDGSGAVDLDYGSVDITDHTFTTDGTGTAEIVLPAGAIDGTEILNDTVDSADYAAGSIDLEHMSSQSVDSDNIVDATIIEADINADEAPVDNDILTFDTTGANFSWQTLAELGIQATVTDGNALTFTGATLDFDGGAAPGGELGGTWGTPTIDDSVTVTGWALGTITSGVGTALTALNGENIQDDTIDDDSIDFADVTGIDLTLTDSGAITASGLITANANLSVANGATTAGVLTLLEDTDAGANFASFQVPALAANTVYTLPADDGDASQILSTNGSGVLDWVADADSGGAPEGTAVLSTGEGGGTKFLREDGDNSCSWQTVVAGHDGTITWTGTSILETGAAFQFGDATDATVTHTYGNTGTNVSIAYSTAAMAVTGALTATNLSGTNTGDNTVATTGDAAVDFFGAGVDAVTDTTTCTDVEGTALSITAGTLNVTEADPTVDTDDEIIAIINASPSTQIVHEAGGLEADISTYGAGLIGQTAGFATIDVDTEAELETAAVGGANILLETEIDASSELLAIMDDETGTGLLVFATSPTFTTSIIMGAATLSETELEILDGALLDTTELNLLNGITTLSGSNTGDEAAASVTVSGVAEIATGAETTTGTDAARTVSPDGLAGSDYGKRIVSILLNGSTALTTSEKGYLRLPAELSGYNLVDIEAAMVAGTGLVTLDLHNVTQADADILSTNLTIDANETDSSTATAAVIDTGQDDVTTADRYRIDVDGAGTGSTYVEVQLVFQLP